MVKARRSKPDAAHDVEIGKMIRSQRLIKRMSQTTLANKLNVTFQQVQKYEKGTNRVSASRLAVIASELGVSIDLFYQARGITGGTRAADLLDTPIVVRLVVAFNKIKSDHLKTAITRLTESLVGG